MLCTLLGSHRDVLCHHELFNPDGAYYALVLNHFETTDNASDTRMSGSR